MSSPTTVEDVLSAIDALLKEPSSSDVIPPAPVAFTAHTVHAVSTVARAAVRAAEGDDDLSNLSDPDADYGDLNFDIGDDAIEALDADFRPAGLFSNDSELARAVVPREEGADEIGGFEGTSVVGAAEIRDSIEFGDFAGPPLSVAVYARQAEAATVLQEGDDFGDFSGASSSAVADAFREASADERRVPDEFGDFAAAPSRVAVEAPHDRQGTDEFSDFAGASLSASTEVQRDINKVGLVADDFGDFAGAASSVIAEAPEMRQEADDFGDFAGAASSVIAEAPEVRQEADDFGDFAGASSSVIAEAPAVSQEADDFGDFAGAPSSVVVDLRREPLTEAFQQTSEFSESTGAPSSAVVDLQLVEVDDFGDFAGAPSTFDARQDAAAEEARLEATDFSDFAGASTDVGRSRISLGGAEGMPGEEGRASSAVESPTVIAVSGVKGEPLPTALVIGESLAAANDNASSPVVEDAGSTAAAGVASMTVPVINVTEALQVLADDAVDKASDEQEGLVAAVDSPPPPVQSVVDAAVGNGVSSDVDEFEGFGSAAATATPLSATTFAAPSAAAETADDFSVSFPAPATQFFSQRAASDSVDFPGGFPSLAVESPDQFFLDAPLIPVSQTVGSRPALLPQPTVSVTGAHIPVSAAIVPPSVAAAFNAVESALVSREFAESSPLGHAASAASLDDVSAFYRAVFSARDAAYTRGYFSTKTVRTSKLSPPLPPAPDWTPSKYADYAASAREAVALELVKGLPPFFSLSATPAGDGPRELGFFTRLAAMPSAPPLHTTGALNKEAPRELTDSPGHTSPWQRLTDAAVINTYIMQRPVSTLTSGKRKKLAGGAGSGSGNGTGGVGANFSSADLDFLDSLGGGAGAGGSMPASAPTIVEPPVTAQKAAPAASTTVTATATATASSNAAVTAPSVTVPSPSPPPPPPPTGIAAVAGFFGIARPRPSPSAVRSPPRVTAVPVVAPPARTASAVPVRGDAKAPLAAPVSAVSPLTLPTPVEVPAWDLPFDELNASIRSWGGRV